MGSKPKIPPETPSPREPVAPSGLAAGSLPRFGVIMALALLLRLIALDWGIPGPDHGPYHPDELNGIKGIFSLWNDPHHIKATYFVSTKGAGYFYTGLAVVALESKLGLLPSKSAQTSRPTDLRRLYLTVRSITVAFSLGTVALVFFVGLRLFGPRAAELAAAIEAVNPISAINAHYIKTDTPEAFWVMLALAFAVWSLRDRRWLAASIFVAGVAGAFKYPGISALLFPLAAVFLLRPEDRRARLRTALLSLPLLAVGFVLFYPGAVLDFKDFHHGLTSEAGRKVFTEWHIPLVRILGYPLALMQANGVVLVLWAWAAMGYALIRRQRESLLLMVWLLPYLLLMSSSVVVLVRYAVPMMPVMALLMASMTDRIAESRPAWARKTRLAAALAVAAIMLVTGLHLRTMLRIDPREMGARWIAANVPRGDAVAITPSHDGDVFFTVRVDRSVHQLIELYFRPEQDASNYLARDFKWLAANEQAWVQNWIRHPSQARFWQEVNDPSRWMMAARFANRPRWPGVLLRGWLPEDMYYLYLEVKIYRRPTA